jgi:hypothetical protein
MRKIVEYTIFLRGLQGAAPSLRLFADALEFDLADRNSWTVE